MPSPALPSDMKLQGVVLRDGKSDFLLLRDGVALERRFSRSQQWCYWGSGEIGRWMPYEEVLHSGSAKAMWALEFRVRVQSQTCSSFSKRQGLGGRMQYLQGYHILPIVLCSTTMLSNLEQNICQLGTSVQPSWHGMAERNPTHFTGLS